MSESIVDVPVSAERNPPPTALDLNALAANLDSRTWIGHDTHGRRGARISVLFEDEGSGQRVALVRVAPGGFSAPHRHEGHESFLILAGTFHDDSGVYGTGELVVYPPGSRHGWTSPEGCLVYAVWGGPVTPVASDAG